MEPDWIMGFAGGLLIGAAASVYLLVNGRVMGASGIVGAAIEGIAGDTLRERLVFLAGLVLVPGLIVLAFLPGTDTNVTSNPVLLIAAGLLVGAGTRMANGCTSGHGVCGISRLSLRGIAATAIYIGFGAVTVLLVRNMLGVS